MSAKRHSRARPLPARDQLLALARTRGILRPRDLAPHGLSRQTLSRLVGEGQIRRRGRGLYVAADPPLSEQESLAAASARVPHGVVCLLSALRFHDLTTQNPGDVWLAIDRKARAPVSGDLPLRIVRFSGKARTEGIGRHIIDGVPVRVYDPAKTVADCFKYRHKIGTDVALEALRECWRAHRCTMDDLWRYAAVCRVARVMRPYLEAVAADDEAG